MASIRDVAKKANVGATTVSRVLNNSGYVSEETRGKIMRAMEELNYTPNELARNLFHKKTGIIAVLVPDVAHPFFSEVVKCIEMELYEQGYKTMICSTIREKNYELEYLDMLNRHIVDGIITGVHSLTDEEYQKIDKPIVSLDRNLGERIPIVGSDHWKGGELAAHALIESGCKNVVQFLGSLAVRTPAHDRHRAFAQAMAQNNVSVRSYELEWNRFDNTYFVEVVERIFRKYPEIDGVFGADLLAAEYVKLALKAGKKVPEDVKVVAYDGTYITEVMTPELTAVVQQIPEIAKKATSCMLKMIGGRVYRNKRVTVDVDIRKRGTT